MIRKPTQLIYKLFDESTSFVFAILGPYASLAVNLARDGASDMQSEWLRFKDFSTVWNSTNLARQPQDECNPITFLAPAHAAAVEYFLNSQIPNAHEMPFYTHTLNVLCLIILFHEMKETASSKSLTPSGLADAIQWGTTFARAEYFNEVGGMSFGETLKG